MCIRDSGRTVLEDMGKRYGLELIGPPVRKSIRFAEAPEMGMCILQHAPGSQGAEAYRAIARIVDADSAGTRSSAYVGAKSPGESEGPGDAEPELESE